MSSTRLLLLTIGVIALLTALVVGAAFDALRQSLRRDRPVTRGDNKPALPAPTAVKRPAPTRYTPRRTRLHWYSPEIAAVLLLSLAAGLWLARLTG